MPNTEPGLFFYANWRETLRELFPDPALRAAAYDAIIDYGITGEEPYIEDATVKVFFSMAKGFLDAKEGKRNRGGQPGNQNASKQKRFENEKTNQNEYFESKTNQTNDCNIRSNLDSNLKSNRKLKQQEQEEQQEAVAIKNKNSKSEQPAAAALESEIEQEENDLLFNEVVKSFSGCGVFLSRSSLDDLRGFFDYGMEAEVLVEAAKRAADAGKATWKYTRGILQSWAKSNVLTLEDVRREDASYERKKAQAIAAKGKTAAPSAYAPIYDGDSTVSGYIGRDEDVSTWKPPGS